MREFGVKRFIGSVAAIAVVCGSAVGLAPGAFAATAVDCGVVGTITVTVTAGSVSTFSPLSNCTIIYARDNVHGFANTVGGVSYTDGSGVHALSPGGNTSSLVGLSEISYTAPANAGHDGIRVERTAGSGVNLEITVVAPSAAEAGGSAPVFQALPTPSSGNCADVKDAAYAWGTRLTGGWQKSWQPWAGPAGSHGGWACARTLVMLDGSRWSIAN